MFLLVFLITLLTKNAEYIEFSSIGFLFSILFYRTTTLKEDKLTKYGTETRKKAIGFKNFLEQYVISKDKPLYMVNILEYNYIMAVAFGFAKLGENEFVHNTYKGIQTRKLTRSIINVLLLIAIVIIQIVMLK